MLAIALRGSLLLTVVSSGAKRTTVPSSVSLVAASMLSGSGSSRTWERRCEVVGR